MEQEEGEEENSRCPRTAMPDGGPRGGAEWPSRSRLPSPGTEELPLRPWPGPKVYCVEPREFRLTSERVGGGARALPSGGHQRQVRVLVAVVVHGGQRCIGENVGG